MMNKTTLQIRHSFFAILLTLSVLLLNSGVLLAHGGEDHGDAKPKTAASTAGIVSHSSRIGDLEILIKHPILKPDTSSSARLFITKYATNEPADGVTSGIEVEAANGSVTQVAVEKTDTAGTYQLKMPALPEGTYTMRVGITYTGETDTVTFPGVAVAHETALATSGLSWLRTTLIFLTGLIVLSLFAGLMYFVWRSADDGEIRSETVSA
ncbi:MAG: hypothetical protein ABI539_11765 [Acidobacteriota bacterium]